MQRHSVATTLLMMLATASAIPAYAHSGAVLAADEAESVFTLQKITERSYCLFGPGGNVGFVVTDAGVLVVDDQYENVASGIVEQIRTVTDKPIRYLVNTHYHSDHTGGNPVFIKFAEIIAHDTVRPRLIEYPETIRSTFPGRIEDLNREIAGIEDPEDPYRAALEKDLGLLRFFLDAARSFTSEAAAPPGLTYEGAVTVWLDDQEIRIFHVAPGHTDGDSMVFFSTENVLHMGDLFFNGMVPFIDAVAGGSLSGSIENIDYAIAHVPPDARVIPGHGPVTDISGLKRLRDYLSAVRSKVAEAAGTGMSRAQAVRAIRMDDYPDIKESFRTLGNLVGVAYDEFRSPR